MKLELKHLVPYLPYKLKAEMLDYKIDYVGMKYDTVIGFHQWDSRDLYWSVLTMGGSKPELNSIKPILRPLSDITKEIEHNGERFIPSNEFQNLYLGDLKWVDNYIGTGLFSKNGDIIDLCFMNNEIVGDCPLSIYELLTKWHFDVFGLIEKGLAIDINNISVKN